MLRSLFISLTFFATSVGCFAAPASKSSVANLQTLVLQGTPYTVVLAKVEYAPAEGRSLHYHTGPEVSYVLRGELRVTKKGHPPQIFRAGQSFQIQAKVPHSTQAGPDGATVLSTWAGAKGQPYVIPVQEK